MSDPQPVPPVVTGVTRWRKKPVTVEAVQWTGDNFAAVKDFASGALGAGEVRPGVIPLWVVKSQALCHVKLGDWIIQEPDGSGFYPCAGDVFAATYEPAGEQLTTAQCDALRRLVTEHQEAAVAVRRALDLTAALDDTDREIIAAGRAGLKVLEGSEEEAGNGC